MQHTLSGSQNVPERKPAGVNIFELDPLHGILEYLPPKEQLALYTSYACLKDRMPLDPSKFIAGVRSIISEISSETLPLIALSLGYKLKGQLTPAIVGKNPFLELTRIHYLELDSALDDVRGTIVDRDGNDIRPLEFLQKLIPHCPHLESLDLGDNDQLTFSEKLNLLNLLSSEKPPLLNLGKHVRPPVIHPHLLESEEFHSSSLRLAGWIDLSDEQIRAMAGKAINPRSVDFSRCKELTDLSVETLSLSWPNLEWISFEGCVKLTDRAIDAITKNCPNLKALHVGGCKGLTDLSLQFIIDKCKKLKILSLSDCLWFSSEKMREVTEVCDELEWLDFSGCTQGIGSVIDGLGIRCPQLKVLNLNGCRTIPQEHIVRAVSQSKLLSLHIGENGMRDEHIEAMAPHCAELRILSLFSNFDLRGTSLRVLAPYCKHLISALLGCSLFSAQEIADFIKECTELRSIYLTGSEGLRGDNLRVLAPYCKSLEIISLSFCSQIDDFSINALTRNCKKLKSLLLENCKNLTGDAIKKLAFSCPTLQRLDLAGCRKIDKLDLKELVEDPRVNLEYIRLPDGTVLKYGQIKKHYRDHDDGKCVIS